MRLIVKLAGMIEFASERVGRPGEARQAGMRRSRMRWNGVTMTNVSRLAVVCP
jgi:hypothetical protein